MVDGKQLVEFFNASTRYPQHRFRGDVSADPVHIGDLNRVCSELSQLVDRLGITEFALRTENWTGVVVVYDMDEPDTRHRLSQALEQEGFMVTTRCNEYGTALEVTPRPADLLTTRYDAIMNEIAAALPEASTIGDLQTETERRLGHAIPIGVLRNAIHVFNISFLTHRRGMPVGSKVPAGMRGLVETALEAGHIPPLCTRLPG